MKWMCGEEPAWLMSRLANEQAGQQLFSCTASLTILTRSSPWNGRGHWILWMIQQISTGALSAALSACCCACFPRLWAVPLSPLPPPPVSWGLLGCSSSFQHVHPNPSKGTFTPHTQDGHCSSGLLLHSLVRGRDFSFKFCFWACAFLAWFNEYCRLWNGESQNNTSSPTGKKGLLSWE